MPNSRSFAAWEDGGVGGATRRCPVSDLLLPLAGGSGRDG